MFARASGAGKGAPSAPSICEVTACATGQSQRVCSRAVASAAAGAPHGQRHGLQRPPGRQVIAARQRPRLGHGPRQAACMPLRRLE
eukprot:84887-Chlamydomonas_euryale.AAC.1